VPRLAAIDLGTNSVRLLTLVVSDRGLREGLVCEMLGG